MLQQCLSVSEWARDARSIIGAAEVLEHPVVDGAQGVIDNILTVNVDWWSKDLPGDHQVTAAQLAELRAARRHAEAHELVVDDISERAREAAKAAVSHALKAGHIPGSRHAAVLLQQLGIE
jgi:hypothetical protein